MRSVSNLQSPVTLLVAIILVAAALRFHNLDSIPPGMTHDEGSIGFFVRQVAEATGFRIDAPYGYANEPLAKYSATPFFWGLGARDWALRAHQAVWGLAAVLFAFLWGHAAFNARVGLGAAALMAVDYWPLSTSRMALNSNPLPGLMAGAAFFLWRGLSAGRRRRGWLHWLGFATCVSLSLYTYEAARAAWVAFPAFLVYLLLFHRRSIAGSEVSSFALALACGTALSLPHLLDPAAWGRTGTLAAPLATARAGDFSPLFANVAEGLGTLFARGDPFVVYNLPGRPVFGPVLGALFLAGVLYCLRRWRRPAHAFALLWLAAGLVPTLVVGAFTSALHSIAAQVVVLAMPVIAADAGLAWLERRAVRLRRSKIGESAPGESAPPGAALNGTWACLTRQHLDLLRLGLVPLGWVAVGAIVAWTGVRSVRDYFGVWANSSEMRAAYFANFGAMTRYIDRLPGGGSIAVSSAFPDLPHDPLVYDLRVQRADLDARWFDAREALVFPDVAESLLFVPVQAYPDAYFAAHLPLSRAERHVVRSTDVDPWFEIVPWQPRQTLRSWLSEWGVVSLADGGIRFGVADKPGLRLIAYAHIDGRPQPGQVHELVTFWRVDDPDALGPRHPAEYGHRARIFVHLLSPTGEILAQQDTLQAPAWNWRAGETFVQIHRLPLPADLPPGAYPLRIGVYRLPEVTNLTTDAGAEYALLPPLEVRGS